MASGFWLLPSGFWLLVAPIALIARLCCSFSARYSARMLYEVVEFVVAGHDLDLHPSWAAANARPGPGQAWWFARKEALRPSDLPCLSPLACLR
jgi:hypothetical protein